MDFLSGKESILDLQNPKLHSFLQSASLDLAKIEAENPLNDKEVEEYSRFASLLLKLTNKATEEIQILLNCCLTNILRIVAPNEILSKSQLNSVFKSINKSVPLLKNLEKPEYHMIIHVLQMTEVTSIASLGIKYGHLTVLVNFIESCLESVVINCCLATEELIENNIRIIFDELPEVTENFMYPVLISLKKEYKNTPRARISQKILSKKIAPLRNVVSALITSLFTSNKSSKSSHSLVSNDRFYLASRLYKLNHDYLVDLFRVLTESIQQKKNDQNLAKMISKIACCKKSTLDTTNSHLFSEFLKFFDSENENIRISMLKTVEKFFKNHKTKAAACENVLTSVTLRIKDLSEKVRISAIQTLMKISEFLVLPQNSVKDICDRMKDIRKPVRKAAVEANVRIFEAVWIKKKLLGVDCPDYFSEIIEKVFRFIQNFGDPDDQCFTIFSIQNLFLRHSDPKLHSEVFSIFHASLSQNSRQVLESLLKNAEFFNHKLRSVLSSSESLETFCGNMKNSVLVQVYKSRLVSSQGELLELLRKEELQELVRGTLEMTELREIQESLKNLEDKAKEFMKGFKVLRARCFNLIVRAEHVPFLADQVEILPLLARTQSQALSPFIPRISQYLKREEARAAVFEVLAEVDVLKNGLEDLVIKEILEIYTNSKLDEAWSVRNTLKNLSKDFIINFTTDLLASEMQNHGKTVIELLFLKKIVKFWPTVVEHITDDLRVFAVRVCENKETLCEAKCLAIVLLHSLVKYCGRHIETIFPYIRKIGFNLSSFYKKRVKAEPNLSANDEKTLRSRCFKSIFTLFSLPEMKNLLDPVTLACLASAVMSPTYTSEISKLVRDYLYSKSNLLTPLLAILGVLLATPETKSASQTLSQVFTKMKQDSLEKEEKERVLRTQPETYTPFLLYVLCKCRLPDKVIKVVLASYFKCLAGCERLDAKYLINLMRQMKKYRLKSHDFHCDLWTLPEKNVELARVCDEMSSLIAAHFVNEDFTETGKDILIPASFFDKVNDVASPDTTLVNRIDSSLRKRGVESSSRQKAFNMFT